MTFHGSKMTTVLGKGVYANVTTVGCYAVKTTRDPTTGIDGGIIDTSYVREWSALTCLEGLPGIVKTYAYDHSQHSILMEQYTSDAEKKSRFDQSEQINVAIDILLGLDSMRQRGILHRDIKPPNVLISGPRAVLCDFGLSRYMWAENCKMTSNVYTDWWRPPELLLESGVKSQYNHSADIWSAGMTILDICMQQSLYTRCGIDVPILQVLELIHYKSINESNIGSRFSTRIQEMRASYQNNLCIPSLSRLEAEEHIEGCVADVVREMILWDPEKRPTPNSLLSRFDVYTNPDYHASQISYMRHYDAFVPRNTPVDMKLREAQVETILDTCQASITLAEIAIYTMDVCLLNGIPPSRDLTLICVWLVTRMYSSAAFCYCPGNPELLYTVLNTIHTVYGVIPSKLKCARGKLIFGYYLTNHL